MAGLDDLDRQIIALLRADARMPVASLAAALKVSRATVRARIDRLVATGTILGFTLVLKGALANAPVRAVTLIEVSGQGAERIVGRLRGFPEIRALHTTNGRWDLVAEIEADSLPGFDDCLRRIRQVEGITATESNILLSTRK
ncbi:MAG TPA: Lrp/AsnC family transcriptional regulator [Salinarimonas sp.]|nr:Lrp/AsnC family transcriptional regulator [Salinarimonas sp.]